MRYILSILLSASVLAGCASSTIQTRNPQDIVVTGVGETRTQAREHAFRLAVEQAMGTIVLAERSIENYELKSNTVSLHSPGYIHSYEVLNEELIQGENHLTIKARVAQARLRDFLLSEIDDPASIDGAQHHAQIQSYFFERHSGDRLVGALLHEHYPKNAYQIGFAGARVEMDQVRQPRLIVEYELSWNYDFLVALDNTLDNASDGRSWLLGLGFPSLERTPAFVRVTRRNNWLIGRTTVHRFSDQIRVEIVRRMIRSNEPRMLLEIKDAGGEVLSVECFEPRFLEGWRHRQRQDPFYHLHHGGYRSPDIWIDGNMVERGFYNMPVRDDIKNVSSVSWSITDQRDERC